MNRQEILNAVSSGANLNGAKLRYADLNGADLNGANLNGADLNGANLNGANLRYADLNGADLRYADLNGANLNGADLRYADLRYADLNGADLHGANLIGTVLPSAPRVDKIDLRILAAIESGGTLDMNTWHTCETTHCRAGWAIHLAGKRGADLEEQFGPAVAGALIYAASGTTLVPDFYADSAEALADIKNCAVKESK